MMTEETVGYLTTSQLITTSWAALWRSGKTYRVLGCQPDPNEPWMPLLRIASGASPAKAYDALQTMTGRPWCVVIREGDLLEITSSEWRALVRATPRLRMISDLLWRRAQLIWTGAAQDQERSQGLWMSLTAAHGEEIAVAPSF